MHHVATSPGCSLVTLPADDGTRMNTMLGLSCASAGRVAHSVAPITAPPRNRRTALGSPLLARLVVALRLHQRFSSAGVSFGRSMPSVTLLSLPVNRNGT